MYRRVWGASLLLALQNHEHLEEVRLEGGTLEEGLTIRLVDMPSLRCCRVKLDGQSSVTLEMDDLPALESLRMNGCGLVEVCDTV